jgi:hypothetical protein
MTSRTNYDVQPGDCLESIAYEHGFFWETLWNHPDNASLKQSRQAPNILLAGDQVAVPPLRPKNEAGATETRHRFKRKGVPSKLEMVLKDKDKPRAGVPYVLEVEGQSFSGQTDAQGVLRQRIPPDARTGRLIVGRDRREIYPLQLGQLDPVSEISGVQARLANLGFYAGAVDGQMNPATAQALKAFQAKHNLPVNGQLNEATGQQLKQAHGC